MGSPPHTRGKWRLFYACLIKKVDHPRIRGENFGGFGGGYGGGGSPPHTRGKLIILAEYTAPYGITPAYAGKIILQGEKFTTPRDHPRIRGENLLNGNAKHTGKGSPPHTRGKYLYPSGVGLPLGITPAYAGKMLKRATPELRQRDHPRIRGENSMLDEELNYRWGSPPHTRGKFRRPEDERCELWITPAYAGKIGIYAGKLQSRGDHPRIRGENTIPQNAPDDYEGSPPHTRGKFQDKAS